MGESDPDAVLALGDLSYGGPGSEPEYCDLVTSEIGEDAPSEILAGNHEEDTGEDGQIASFADCLPDRVGAVGEYGIQYYFDVGRLARFIMISPDLTIEGGTTTTGPRRRCRQRPSSRGSRTHRRGPRRGTMGHRRDAQDCISVGEYYCDVYQDLFTALIEERVDLVLSAHDHSYQRSKQISLPAPRLRRGVGRRLRPDCVVDDDDIYRRGAGTGVRDRRGGRKPSCIG